MIIFYEKKTGKIKGTIDGRIHSPEHLKMWIGSKEENDRLIVNWKPIKKKVMVPVKELRVIDGNKIKEVVVGEKEEEQLVEWVPDCKFPEIIKKIDMGTENLKDYKVKLNKFGKVIGLT